MPSPQKTAAPKQELLELRVSASFHGSRTMKRWTVCSAVTAEETAIFGTCAAAVAVGAQIPISCSRSCAGPRAALR